VNDLDKKTLSVGLIALSVLAAVLAAVDFLNLVDAPVGLGANSWMMVAIALGIYSNYAKAA
jgi:hypothetical protein